jgi:hypothetical protein
LGPGSQTEVENVGVVRKTGIVNLGRGQDLVKESALSAEDGVPKASQRSRCITEKRFLSEIGTEQDSLQIDHERTSFGHRHLRRRRSAVSHPYLGTVLAAAKTRKAANSAAKMNHLRRTLMTG